MDKDVMILRNINAVIKLQLQHGYYKDAMKGELDG